MRCSVVKCKTLLLEALFDYLSKHIAAKPVQNGKAAHTEDARIHEKAIWPGKSSESKISNTEVCHKLKR